MIQTNSESPDAPLSSAMEEEESPSADALTEEEPEEWWKKC